MFLIYVMTVLIYCTVITNGSELTHNNAVKYDTCLCFIRINTSQATDLIVSVVCIQDK